MSDYPNREHRNADSAARRRAIAALNAIVEDAETLLRRLANGYEPYGKDAARFAEKATDLAVNLSALETLRDAREWDAPARADTGREAE